MRLKCNNFLEILSQRIMLSFALSVAFQKISLESRH